MKDFRNKKNSILLFAALTTVMLANSQTAFSNETFQNNLLKMDVSKTSSNGVKVILYTTKPYNDSVVVNKKSDREYVILMPETANSLASRPAAKSASDVVQNVEVKTQPYTTKGQKGYTKIIFSTTKPIEITTSLQTLKSENRISEKEYSELMEQAAKKKTASAPAKTAKASSAKTVAKKQTISTAKTVKEPPRPTAKKPGESSVGTPKIAQKVMKKLAPKVEKASKQIQRSQQNPVQKAKSTSAPTVTREAKNLSVQPQTAKQVQQQPQTVQTPPQATKQTTETPVLKPETPVTTTPVTETNTNVLTQPVKERKLAKIKRLATKNLYTTAAITLLPILLLLILLKARKSSKNSKEQISGYTKTSSESSSPMIDYTEKINDEMDWKEKFQAYSEAKTEQTEQEIQPQESPTFDKSELDGLFSENGDTFEEEIEEVEKAENEEEVQETTLDAFEETTPETIDTETEEVDEFSFDDEMKELGEEEILGTEEASIEDLFGGEEIAEVAEETPLNFESEAETILEDDLLENLALESEEEIEGEEEEDNFVKSNFEIDSKKGFCLVDVEGTTALVGYINDDVYVLKRFDAPVTSPVQARLNETKGNSSNYIVKTHGFKAIVEVSPNNMNLLIEL